MPKTKKNTIKDINKVIGIDVGTNNLAAAVFIKEDLIDYKILENKKTLSVGQKLINIEDFLDKIFEIEKPDAVVVEGSFWNPREARGYSQVSAAMGIIQATAWRNGQIEPVKLQPSTVKKMVAGNGRATKDQVAEAVKRLYQIEKDLPDHTTDSIAVGTAYILQQTKGEELT